jgi:hypothetical protein
MGRNRGESVVLVGVERRGVIDDLLTSFDVNGQLVLNVVGRENRAFVAR